MASNPYFVLGVRDGASLKECTKAYKKLAKKYHPDLHPDDDSAVRKMVEINNAYEDIKSGRVTANSYDEYDVADNHKESNARYYNAAVSYINNGQYTQALNLLNKIEFRDAHWYYVSSVAHYRRGNKKKAIFYIKIANQMAPNNETYMSAEEKFSSDIN